MLYSGKARYFLGMHIMLLVKIGKLLCCTRYSPLSHRRIHCNISKEKLLCCTLYSLLFGTVCCFTGICVKTLALHYRYVCWDVSKKHNKTNYY
jgi:hypothetical protein